MRFLSDLGVTLLILSGLFAWGCLLLVVFDRLLTLLDRAWVRWAVGGLLPALPFGVVAAIVHHVLDRALVDFVTAGSPLSTFVMATLAAWAGAIQIMRWRSLRAVRARESALPALRLLEAEDTQSPTRAR